jgi:hypothetical protein
MQAHLLQVLRRDRQHDRVADGLVEAVVGAVLVEGPAACSSSVVVVVPELVVQGVQVLLRGLDAHLDAQIVRHGEVPGARVADDVAVGRLE